MQQAISVKSTPGAELGSTARAPDPHLAAAASATATLSTDLLVNEPLTFPPADAIPPAEVELVGMIHEFLALKAPRDAEFAALNKVSTRTPGLKARWAAWREGCTGMDQLEKRIARTPALTLEGALLKAKLGAILLTGGDVQGSDLAADDGPGPSRLWGVACGGIADLLRLKGMLSSQPAGSDAELITACAAFDELERASHATFRGQDFGSPEEAKAEEERDRIYEQQQPLIDRILDLPCTTLAGFRAVAQSLALENQRLLQPGSGHREELLASKLVKSLIAMDPTAGPDAELIAASAEFRRLLDVLDACDFEAEADTPREEAAIAEQRRVNEAILALGRRMAGMVATTNDGLAARAKAMGRSDPHHDHDHEHEGGLSLVLLDALLRDGAALAGVPTPNPDAELLALRPEYERLHAEYVACSAPAVPDEKARPAFVAFDRFCARVAQMPPAVTAEGRALQAICVLHQLVYAADWDDGEEPTGAEGLAWQVLAGQVG